MRAYASSIPGCSRSFTCTYVDMAFNMISLLVTYRMTVVAAIAGAQAVAGFRIHEDALAIAPIPVAIALIVREVVSHLLESVECIRRDPLLHIFDIRQPLIMKAWRIH